MTPRANPYAVERAKNFRRLWITLLILGGISVGWGLRDARRGNPASPEPQAKRPTPVDPNAWKKNYMGATVILAGAKWTVVGEALYKVEVLNAQGAKVLVDWSVVVNQVDKAYSGVEK